MDVVRRDRALIAAELDVLDVSSSQGVLDWQLLRIFIAFIDCVLIFN